MLAEGMGERCLSPRGPRLAQTHRPLKDLAVRVHKGDQRDGNLKDTRRQTGEAVEGGIRRGIFKRRSSQRGKPAGILKAVRKGDWHRPSQFALTSNRKMLSLEMVREVNSPTQTTISRHLMRQGQHVRVLPSFRRTEARW